MKHTERARNSYSGEQENTKDYEIHKSALTNAIVELVALSLDSPISPTETILDSTLNEWMENQPGQDNKKLQQICEEVVGKETPLYQKLTKLIDAHHRHALKHLATTRLFPIDSMDDIETKFDVIVKTIRSNSSISYAWIMENKEMIQAMVEVQIRRSSLQWAELEKTLKSEELDTLQALFKTTDLHVFFQKIKTIFNEFTQSTDPDLQKLSPHLWILLWNEMPRLISSHIQQLNTKEACENELKQFQKTKQIIEMYMPANAFPKCVSNKSSKRYRTHVVDEYQKQLKEKAKLFGMTRKDMDNLSKDK